MEKSSLDLNDSNKNNNIKEDSENDKIKKIKIEDNNVKKDNIKSINKKMDKDKDDNKTKEIEDEDKVEENYEKEELIDSEKSQNDSNENMNNSIINHDISIKDDINIKQSINDIIISENLIEEDDDTSDKNIVHNNMGGIIDELISDREELYTQNDDSIKSDSLISDYESGHNQLILSPEVKMDDPNKLETNKINFEFKKDIDEPTIKQNNFELKDDINETPINTLKNKLLDLNDIRNNLNESDSDDLIDSPLKNKVSRLVKPKTNTSSTKYHSLVNEINKNDEEIIQSSYENESNIKKEKVIKVKSQKNIKNKKKNEEDKKWSIDKISDDMEENKNESSKIDNMTNSDNNENGIKLNDQSCNIQDQEQNNKHSNTMITEENSTDNNDDDMSLVELIKKNQRNSIRSTSGKKYNVNNNSIDKESESSNITNNDKNSKDMGFTFSIDEKKRHDEIDQLICNKNKNNDDFNSNIFYSNDDTENNLDSNNSSFSSSTDSVDSEIKPIMKFTDSIENSSFNNNEKVVQEVFDWIFKYRCIAKNVEPSFENLTLINSLIPLTSKPNQLHSPTPHLLFSYSQTLINSLKDNEPSQTHYENLLLWIETLEIKRRSNIFDTLKKLDIKESNHSLSKDGKSFKPSINDKNSNETYSNSNPQSYNICNDSMEISNNDTIHELDSFSIDSSLETKIEKRFENAYLLLKKQIFNLELQKIPFNPVNCKALLNKLFPVNDEDAEAINLKHYASPRLDYTAVIYSMEEYIQQKVSTKKNSRKKKNARSKELEIKDNKENTPIYEFGKSTTWKQTKVALEFYMNSIRKCLY
ncbi:hypothetical protein BCR36DRAFT_586123 [Piromyces finnis]|uniref:Uncharacterized protein n=1 Tax=Piromyces finnis TaxID=1754191 RepID=A0A1Y1V0C4_9FUNG|nr:hypothetical protein BCR36DRAFT_586123 [Piromyces finnis]|eukprot:ORX44507.1 hypothetical protein BCR36DRAFT_586123 [Piromyces finnis]